MTQFQNAQTSGDPVEDSPRLARTITQSQLVLYGLGVTIGAGIYVLIGSTAAIAGVYAPVSFLVAALVVLFTAVSYGQLAARYPVSAGEAAYVQAGFQNRTLSLIVGLLVALSGIVSAAAVANGSGSYLAAFIDLPLPVLTIVVVLLTGTIVMWGIAQSVIVATFITIVEFGGLLLVIIWGGQTVLSTQADLMSLVPPADPQILSSILVASVLAFFAFIGFEDMANVAEEVREPSRTLPRAIIITLVVASLLYFLVAAVVVLAVPMEQLAGAEAPLSLVFQNAPLWLVNTFGAIAVLATINGILIQMIMASRVVYGLADRHQIPAVFAVVFARTQTPVPATIFVMVAVGIFATAMPIEALAQQTSRIVLVVFILVNLALFRLNVLGGDISLKRRILSGSAPLLGALTSAALLVVSLL